MSQLGPQRPFSPSSPNIVYCEIIWQTVEVHAGSLGWGSRNLQFQKLPREFWYQPGGKLLTLCYTLTLSLGKLRPEGEAHSKLW